MIMRALPDVVPRRSARTRILVALTVTIVLALGTVWAWAGPAVTFRVATAPAPSAFFHTARAEGRLGGQVNLDGTACFWLGAGSDREALSWPYGFTARGGLLNLAGPLASASPIGRLAVYSETGGRVAEVGQYVVMGGGLLGGDGRSIVGCSGFAELWGVGLVVSAT